jgi:hypothetical protein
MEKNTDAAKAHGLKAAWTVLVGMGGASVAFNVYHAVHGDLHNSHGHLTVWLAVVFGLAPVGAAMGLSHIATCFRAGWYSVCTYGVMFGAMALSAGATADVVAPVAGPVFLRWLFPVVLDSAALLALKAIISPEQETGAGRQPPSKASRRTGSSRAATGSATATGVRQYTRTPVAEAVAAPVASGTAEPKAARERQPNGSATDSRMDDLDTEAKAFDLLRANPKLSGADLDRAMGFSPNSGRGRQLKRKLTAKYPEDLVPSGSPSGDGRTSQK